jgi:NADPH:quinone reductase-like Zn-dependent oxidoreductase
VVGLVPSGGWAEQVAVPLGSLAELPDGVDLGAAATLPVAGLTAQVAMQLGGTAGDERVLVTGAAGGVGHFALQLAAHRGATVTAVVGRPERAGGLKRLGATTVSVGMPEDGEFELVLEAVGGATLGAALGMVAPGGHVVSYGCASGEPTTFDVRTFYGRCGRLTGFQLGAELARLGPDAAARDLEALARMLAAGQLEVRIGLDVGWEQAATACRALLDRQVTGKAVLRIG